jgi:hypothetical protein
MNPRFRNSPPCQFSFCKRDDLNFFHHPKSKSRGSNRWDLERMGQIALNFNDLRALVQGGIERNNGRKHGGLTLKSRLYCGSRSWRARWRRGSSYPADTMYSVDSERRSRARFAVVNSSHMVSVNSSVPLEVSDVSPLLEGPGSLVSEPGILSEFSALCRFATVIVVTQ